METNYIWIFKPKSFKEQISSAIVLKIRLIEAYEAHSKERKELRVSRILLWSSCVVIISARKEPFSQSLPCSAIPAGIWN